MSSPPASAADGAPAVTEAAAADPVAAAAPAPAAPAAEEGPEFLKLDVRVGRIVSIERHPDADG
jgi:tRNA-binding EMAP/Myf-like protein